MVLARHSFLVPKSLQLCRSDTVYLDVFLNIESYLMKRFSLMAALGLALLPISLHAQPAGSWTGAIDLPNVQLGITVHFAADGDVLTATIDIPMQGAMGLPLQNVRYEEPTVHFELQAGPGLAVFEGALADAKITGTFAQAGINAPFSLEPEVQEASADDDDGTALGTSVELDTGSGMLSGTLLMPEEADNPIPVALIIAGSGPTDRDGNTRAGTTQMVNNSLQMLAEALAAKGVATLRYDKRGVAASIGAAKPEADLRFDDFVADAIGWLTMLTNDDRFAGTFIIGHSEGALIAKIAAQQADVAGVVSLAGAGRSAPVVLDDQLSAQLPPDAMATARSIIEALKAGDTVADVPPMLQSLFRPSIQPYISSWFRYDPAVEITKLDMPVLIVQGSTDIQVTMPDYEALVAAHPDADAIVFEGMNHVLKTVSGDRMAQLPTYANPNLPLHDGLAERIAMFIVQ